ncbi:MAG: hypothetical protein Q9201_002833 [Fulgogasparrea decipioides]
MLAKIVGVKDAKTNKEIETFNNAIPILSELHSGKHIQVADMSSIQAKGLIQDGIHPNDDSYKFMAQQWLDGIKKAVARGWVKNPIGPDPKPSKGSNKDCHNKRSDPGTSPGNGPLSCGDLAVPSATSGKPAASADGVVKPSAGHPAEPSNPAPKQSGSIPKASSSAPKPVGHPPEPSNPSKPAPEQSGSAPKVSSPASKSVGHSPEPSNPSKAAPEQSRSTPKVSSPASKPVGHSPEPSNASKAAPEQSRSTPKVSSPASKPIDHPPESSNTSKPAPKQSNSAPPPGPKQSGSPGGAGPKQTEAHSVSVIRHSTTLPGGKISVVTTSTAFAPPPGAAAPKPSSPGPKASSPAPKPSGTPSAAGPKQTPPHPSEPKPSKSSSIASSSSAKTEEVFIDPGIWESKNPGIYCVPPCIFILPPLTLTKPTIITFPPLTTSLEVVHKTTKVVTSKGKKSTSTSYDRSTQTTTITIPPVTTDKIDFWNVVVTSGGKPTIHPTSSILPPPFVITNDRKSGEPIVTRTITPRPFPYDTSSSSTPTFPPPISFTNKGDDNDHGSGKPGKKKGGPPCLLPTGCGHKCGDGLPGPLGIFAKAVLCNKPCLTDCLPHPHPDFIDPSDPDPPKLPPILGLPPGPAPNKPDPKKPNPPPGPGPEKPDPKKPNPPPDTKPSGPSPTSEKPKSCTTKMVTDYWVDCTTISSKTTSCKTKNSSVVRGCTITATTHTTVGGSCPLITLNPDEDQGEDGTATKSKPKASSKAGGNGSGPAKTTKSSAKPPATGASPPPTFLPIPAAAPGQPKKPDGVYFALGYFQRCVGPNAAIAANTKCDTRFAIFDYTNSEKKFNGCKDPALWEAPKYVQKGNTKYPVKMGPFDGEGRAGCNYVREKDKDAGTLKCDKGGEFKCEKVKHPKAEPCKDAHKEDEKGDSWKTQVNCIQEHVPSDDKPGESVPAETSEQSPPPKPSSTSKPPPATLAPPSGPMLPKPPAKKGEEHKPNGVYFVIGYFIEGYAIGKFNLDLATARPAVFDYTNSKFTFDACKNKGDNALWTDKKGIKNTRDRHFPVWPIRIGPFAGEGRQGCNYFRSGAGNAGSLKCDVGGEFKCDIRTEKENTNVYCDREKDWWFTPQVNCIQAHVPDQIGEIVSDGPDKKGGFPGGGGAKPTGLD